MAGVFGPGGLGHKLNVVQTAVFLILFLGVLFFTGGLFAVLISFVVAAAASIALYHFVLNKRQPVPGNAAVLVTGASSGIGRHAAIQLAVDGYLVFATVRKEADAAGLTAPKGAKGRIVPLICDICDVNSLVEARVIVERECEAGGKDLQGIVNNAGYAEAGPLEVMPLEALRRQLDTNVVGQVAVSQVFLPLLRKRKRGSSSLTSRLVFVSSGVGRISLPKLGAYCASKFCLEGIADAFRGELRKWNVDVCVVQPGAISTEFTNTRLKTLGANVVDNTANDHLHCSPEVAQVYREASAKHRDQKRFGVEHTTNAIQGALRDSRPFTRYRAGPDCEFFIPIMANWVPDSIRDRIFGGDFK